jgi:putative ABC transport system permease protein
VIHKRRWIVLGVLLGVGLAAAGTALVAARTTATAFERIRSEAGGEALSISHGQHPDVVESALGDIDGVDALYHRVGMVFDLAGDVPQSAIQAFFGNWDGDAYPAGLVAIEGRLPDPNRPEEVAINPGAAERAGISVGDEVGLIHLRLDDPAAGEPEIVGTPVTVRVVGVAAVPRELFDDEAAQFGAMVFSPAFTREEVDTAFWSETAVVTDDPAAIAAVQRRVTELGWDPNQSADVDEAVADDSVRPLVVALTVLAGLVLVATALVGAQALARQLDAHRRDVPVLEAVGVDRRQFVLVDVASALTVGAVAAVVAAMGTTLGSMVGPLGWAAGVDPRMGIHVDVVVVGGIALVAVAIAALTGVAAGRRRTGGAPERSARVLPTWVPSKPVAQAAGGLLAGDDRRRLTGGVVVAGLGVAVLVTVTVFLTSLRGLVEQPDRYGVVGDLIAREQYGDLPVEELDRRFSADADVDEVTGYGQTTFLVDGATTTRGVVVFPVKSGPSVTLADGRLPDGPGEILAGAATLDALGLTIGDAMSIQRIPGPDDQFESEVIPPAVRVTIVGSPVLAPVSMGLGAQPARLDEGLWVPVEDLRAAGDEPDPPEWVFVDVADGADPQAVIARNPPGPPVRDWLPPPWPSSVEWLASAEPTEVSQAEAALPLLVVTAIVGGLTVAAIIGQSRLSQVRQQRRQYGLLKALGYSRRQIIGTVVGQASVVAALALVIGLPVGLVAGRLWWDAFSAEVGVLDVSEVQVGAIFLVALGVAVIVNAVALIPATMAARIDASHELGGERT